MFDTNQIQHTPAFVLDYDRFTKNLQLIKDLQQQAPVKFLFALKGFAMHAVFAELAETACGATASSLNEALLASPYLLKSMPTPRSIRPGVCDDRSLGQAYYLQLPVAV